MTRAPGRRVVLVLLIAGAALAARTPAQSPESSVAVLLDRAGKYEEAFEKAFSAIVCEEQQVQTLVRSDGKISKKRLLKSDFFLVRTGTGNTSLDQIFRDVLEVDGKPIKDHDTRLRKLFLEGSKDALEQARAVAKESGRHNIGLSRDGNSPLLPLRVLNPRLASRFRFTEKGSTLTFEETQTPTYLATHNNGVRSDMFSRGSFDIDAATGRVLTADLTANGPPDLYSLRISVTYRDDAQLKIMVPSAVKEEYWRPAKPKEDRLLVTATYSAFRTFQVSTTEIIK